MKTSGKTKHRNNKVARILSELSGFLPPQTMEFVKTQVKMSDRSKQGRRWTSKDKMFALSIYYQSQKAYKLLRKIFYLPSKSTLQKTLQKTSIYAGLNEKILHAVECKARYMQENDKDCILLFDEMAIKEGLQYNQDGDFIEGFEDLGGFVQGKSSADHAAVFMIRGLQSKWKQPIAYFLVSGQIKPSTLQVLTHACITKIEKTGLRVHAFVCDQGSNNRSFLESLEKVSLEKPYFLHNKKKVFVFYDPPHLLKSIRNNFKKTGFHWKGSYISWDHVTDFYHLDKSMSVKMAPKLKDKHINLPPFSSMRVHLAAQVLSHSVAAGINTMAAFGKLSEGATMTAQFIDNFDKLFNAFNSGSLKSSQPMGHAFSEKSGHKEFLDTMTTFLDEISLANGRSIPCLKGWKITINSLLSLWNNLKTSQNFLMTNRLNQDCLENLFSVIRGKCGHCDNSDAVQFRTAFQYVVVEKLFLQSENSNCKIDFDNILLDLSCITKGPTTSDDGEHEVRTSSRLQSSRTVSPLKCQVQTF